MKKEKNAFSTIDHKILEYNRQHGAVYNPNATITTMCENRIPAITLDVLTYNEADLPKENAAIKKHLAD